MWLMATVSSETLIEVDENGDEYELKRFYIQGRQLRGDGSQSQCVVTRRKRNSRALTTFGTANRNISVTSQPLKVEAMPGKEHREGEQDLEVKHRYVALTGVHFEPNVQDDDEDDDEDFEDEEDNVPVNSPKGESNFVPAALALPLASAAGASPAVQTSQSHLAQGVSVVANSASHANVAGDAGIVVVQSHQPPKVNPDTHAVFELKPVQADTPGYPFVHPWEYEPDDEDDYDEEDYDDFYYGSDYRDHNGYYPLGEYDELVHEEINPVTTTAYWSTGDDDSDIHPVINQANKRPNQGQKNKKKNKKNNNQKQKQNQKNRNQLQKRRKQQQAAENQQKQKKKPEKNQQDKKKDPKDQKDKEEEELQGVKPVDVIKKPESSSMTESSASAASSSSTSSQSSVSNSSDKKKPKKKKKKPSSSSSISSSTSVRRKKKKPSSSSSSLSSSSNKRRRPSSSSSSSNIGGYRRRRPQQQQQQQQQRLQDQRRRRRRQQQQKRRRQQQQQQKRRRQQQQRRRRLGNKNRQFYGDEPIINCIYINKDPPTTTTTTARPFWNILGRQSQDSAPAAPKDNGAVAAVAPASESDASDVDPAAQQAVLQAVRRNFGEFGGRKRVNLRFVS
ncbi:hypothetical protein KR074_003229 [Drosophila pseudoananassae]|nr:hypothetical protein KR074_003229 [Drosophila pseudoananassae]